MHILIADDESHIRNTLSQGLQHLTPWQISTAKDGQEAFNLLLNHPIDAMLLDLRMPNMSGIDVLRDMKKHHIQTAVIVMTGYADVKTAVQAMKLGAKDLFPKPLRMPDCVAALKNVLNPYASNGLVKRIDKFICENAHQISFQASDICAHFAISRSYLAYLLRTECNTTLTKQRTHYRMAKAKHLLATTSDPIYLIAEQCGYKNHRRFAEAFRKHQNLAPPIIAKFVDKSGQIRQKRTL